MCLYEITYNHHTYIYDKDTRTTTVWCEKKKININQVLNKDKKSYKQDWINDPSLNYVLTDDDIGRPCSVFESCLPRAMLLIPNDPPKFKIGNRIGRGQPTTQDILLTFKKLN